MQKSENQTKKLGDSLISANSFQNIDKQIVGILRQHPFLAIGLAIGIGYLSHTVIKKITGNRPSNATPHPEKHPRAAAAAECETENHTETLSKNLSKNL